MCVFCDEFSSRSILTDDFAGVILDEFPVTEGHSLIIPKRHVASYFDLTTREVAAINSLLEQQRAALQRNDPTITGFNIGINVGASAGQTVFHCHVHLIPRRDNDVEDPRGGIRGVIPGKQRY